MDGGSLALPPFFIFLLDNIYPYRYNMPIPRWVWEGSLFVKSVVEKLEALLELGGVRKDIVFLALSGAAVLCSLVGVQPLPFDIAWVAWAFSRSCLPEITKTPPGQLPASCGSKKSGPTACRRIN